MLNAAGGLWGEGCCKLQNGTSGEPLRGCEEVWENCVLWLVVIDIFDYILKGFIFVLDYIFILYLTIPWLLYLFRLFYWFIGWCSLYHNGTYNAIEMMSSLPYTLWLFQSDLVLESALQIRAGQRSITANFRSLTSCIYHVMIIVTGSFSNKYFF